MKREKWISCLIAAILAFCISFGGAACIVTGFSLNLTDGSVSASFYTVPANLWTIFLFCAVFSVAAVAAFSFRRGSLILMGVLALVLGYLWRIGILETSVEAILYRITYAYDKAYRCGVVKWTDAYSPQISPDIGLCIFAGITVLVTAWTVCRRKKAILSVLCGCTMLGVCLVVTDTVPAIWCLFLLLTGVILLILTNTVRRQCAVDGNRLTALMLVPAVLYMSLLFGVVPREGYEPRADALQQAVVDFFRSFSFGDLFDLGFTGGSAGSVDLTTLGPRTNLKYAVMDVVADKGGMLYLRGQSLDVYDGTSWKPSKVSTGEDTGWPKENCEVVGSVTLYTRSGMPIKYFPYYPGGPAWPGDGNMIDGSISNPHREREYTFLQLELTRRLTDAALSSELREQCLLLPHDTKVQAKNHLTNLGNLSGKTIKEIAGKIGRYVSGVARYDLNTGRMPSYENDFAMWFLQDSETGYCIHFASAAVVLLRAAGIPARYVSGYVIKADAGEKVTVTEERAHAWVEYYAPGEGWMMLDPTPGSWYVDSEETTAPPETTGPATQPSNPETTPDSRPTQPGDQPTGPDNQPTQPSQEPTTPNGNGGGNMGIKIDLSWMWPILKWIGILLSIIFVIGGQYLLRIRLRHKHMHTGHPNKRALARWQKVVRMSRLMKEQPPEELYELAEKAKFSQHTLTVAERMEFDRYLDRADGMLREKPWLMQWLIRLIWAV